MIESIRGKLSFANVMSMVAVMIALGGTSYAASVARNSVGSPQIKPKAVKNSDLGNSAVTSPKVRDGSLLAKDFAHRPAPGRREGRHGRDRGRQARPGRRAPTGPTGRAPARRGCKASQGPAGRMVSAVTSAARTSRSRPVPAPAFPAPSTSGFCHVPARRDDHRRQRQRSPTSRN